MIETTGLKGEFEVFLYDPSKNLKAYRHVKNLTVTAGFTAVCDMMGRKTGQPVGFTGCAVGTGTTAPAAGDTILETEATRVGGGYTRSSSTVWKNDATFGAGVGTGALTEAGLFNSETTDGTLLCRQTFAVINKASGDTLVVTWQYTLS